MADQNQSNLSHDYEEIVSIWEKSSGNRFDGRFGADYFIGESFLGSSGFSNKSVSISNEISEQKETPGGQVVGLADTISLTDMLKTNCSRKAISSVGRMEGFHKLTNSYHQHLQNQTPLANQDDLEAVSNRKLQNRANSKRAREKRKQQLEYMREIIRDLRSQNFLLKENMEQRKRSLDIGRIQKETKLGSRWRYCKRCNRDMYLQRKKRFQQDQNGENSPEIISDLQEEQKQSQHKYLHLYQEGFKYQSKQNSDMNHMKGRRLEITKGDTRKQNNYQNTEMQAQFQEIDFGIINKKKEKNVDIKQNNIRDGRRRRDRRWVGKMWIALSILMLVLGIQINGLEGSGQKSIRINQKQAKRWMQEFQDPEKSSLTFKMKSKIPNTFIKSQKDYSKDESWQDDYLQNKPNTKKPKPKNKNPTANELNQQAKSWLNSISFQTDHSYARTLIQQQQDEIQIDKDLLFSIHAEFDDIGRYI